MTGPVAGGPAALVEVADALGRGSEHIERFRRDVGGPVRAVFEGWRGTAAPVALARLDEDLDVLSRAAEVCRIVAPALRAYADELRRAQRDVAEAPVSDTADPTTGARVVESAEASLAFVAEDTARVVRDATSLLPAPTPVDTEGGNALDGLVKAGGDLVDEVGATLRGAFDRVNVFSDRFGEAWSETGATVAAIATDPMGALDTVVDGVTAPIAESYRTGGVDEAAARGAGTIAAALLGGKGLTKLGKLVPDAPPRPRVEGPAHSMRRVPDGGLKGHDERGGHSYAKHKAHVGASDAEMRDRLAREPRRDRVSSYTNWLVAERSAYDNVRGNAERVKAWLEDPAQRRSRPFRLDHGQIVGRTMFRDGGVSDTTWSTVVLKKDPSSPLGYYILSTYPGK